ncbi:hypothetical protein WME99_19300 [Sorangium sp. So ce136]|uniref:hypothetical protein n=1 Tax=Sorangium sp. So ce136 TaxID=3133284 RepID=UPI003F00952F
MTVSDARATQGQAGLGLIALAVAQVVLGDAAAAGAAVTVDEAEASTEDPGPRAGG